MFLVVLSNAAQDSILRFIFETFPGTARQGKGVYFVFESVLINVDS